VACARRSQGVECATAALRNPSARKAIDVGLRVLVGQARLVSTNDVSGDGIARLAERAVAMARRAPMTKCRSRRSGAAGADSPISLLDPRSRRHQNSNAAPVKAEAAASRKGSPSPAAHRPDGIGGM